MKFSSFFIGIVLLLGLSNCTQETKGTLIKGQLQGAENLQVALDKLMIAEDSKQLAVAAVEADGDFALGFEQELEPGIYQLRIGAQSALLSVENGENRIKLNGSLTDLNSYTFAVEGSPSTEELKGILQQMTKRQLQIDDVEGIIGGIENPNTAAFVAYSTLGRSAAVTLPIHEAALERMSAENPNKAKYAEFIAGVKEQKQAQLAGERIRVGQPAPDIAMKSPDGKEYKLSDLKGQVVLLDFWASWCRPCRAENPNVVKVYDKYKNDGFTIYSVSLDGMDPRRSAGLTPEQLAKGNASSKQRWINAIQQDQLSWPYHVSELKKWDSSAGRDYGVRGIPKTFLIDREGKIAAVGLRGASSIEAALRKVI